MNKDQRYSEDHPDTRQTAASREEAPFPGSEQNPSPGMEQTVHEPGMVKDKHRAGESETADNEISGEDHAAPNLEVEQLLSENGQLRDTLLRKAAEFENYKKRTQKEKLHVHEEARAEAVSAFLHLREDLKRSLDAASSQQADKGLVDGLTMILQSFDRVLSGYGLQAIEQIGVPFSVDEHDAMLIQPPPDPSVESNTVLQVLEPGYRMGDRVIRHAKVIVSQ